MGSNPYYNLPGMAERITRPNHPATLSSNDAQEFIARLTGWRAATATACRPRPSGNTPPGLERPRLISSATTRPTWAATPGLCRRGTHPVGQKAPNSWGLHDIHGNAWEWVQDWFDPDYYASSPSVDPAGPRQESKHVVRGGSWHATATSWRTAFRRDYDPDYRGISIGFRLLRTAE